MSITEATETTEDREAAERADCATGYRRLADLIEANPGVPLPYEYDCHHVTVFVDTAEEFAAFAETFGGRLIDNWHAGQPAIVARLGGLEVVARPSARASLGERVEVGQAPVYEYRLPEVVEALRAEVPA